MTHQAIWGGSGRLYWGRCSCGWQSGAYRSTADAQRSYASHLARQTVHDTTRGWQL